MKVFISYRRDDRADIVTRVSDRLMREIGRENVFLDIDSLASGDEFLGKIRHALDQADIMLVVIGPDWLDAQTPGGRRRLDDPNDWVRQEMLEALERDDVRVVPLLVDGATMPKERELPAGLKGFTHKQFRTLAPGTPSEIDLDKLNWDLIRSAKESNIVDAAVARISVLGNQLDDLSKRVDIAAKATESASRRRNRRLWMAIGIIFGLMATAFALVEKWSYARYMDLRNAHLDDFQRTEQHMIKLTAYNQDILRNITNRTKLVLVSKTLEVLMPKKSMYVSISWKVRGGTLNLGYILQGGIIENETGSLIDTFTMKIPEIGGKPSGDPYFEILFNDVTPSEGILRFSILLPEEIILHSPSVSHMPPPPTAAGNK